MTEDLSMRQAIEQLLGIVETMVADGDLDDLEIEFLKVWLAEHRDVARVWPGHAISGAIETVLADGHVSEDERAYLMSTLTQLAAGDFVFDDPGGAAGAALPFGRRDRDHAARRAGVPGGRVPPWDEGSLRAASGTRGRLAGRGRQPERPLPRDRLQGVAELGADPPWTDDQGSGGAAAVRPRDRDRLGAAMARRPRRKRDDLSGGTSCVTGAGQSRGAPCRPSPACREGLAGRA